MEGISKYAHQLADVIPKSRKFSRMPASQRGELEKPCGELVEL